jgi:acylphosphatase
MYTVFMQEVEAEIILRGKVQQVHMREYIFNRACELGVCGTVRNCEDGSVEIIAQGERNTLEKFIKLAKKGSVFARVEETEITWYDSIQDPFRDFSIE